MGENQAERSARTGHQDRLGEQLTREPQPRCAQREPDAQLVPPRHRAREQKIGDVGAGDEQHEADDDENRRQRLLVPAAQRR